MSTSKGLVLVTARQDRAVYLSGTELAGLREFIAGVVARPTIAGGTIALEGLERLARAMELADYDERFTVLSRVEQSGLDLVRNQAAIRATLPVRLRRICRDCGYERLVNPAKPLPKATGYTGPRIAAADLIDGLDTALDGHPWLALGGILLGANWGDDEPAAQAELVSCDRCDGIKFEHVPATFCPQCREIRDETILHICPHCRYQFSRRAPQGDFWLQPETALAAALLALNVGQLTAAIPQFENGLYASQKTAIFAALRPDEQLIGLTRCNLPGAATRNVALLLTTRQLVWSRESMWSQSADGDAVAWSEVVAIEPREASKSYERGVRIEARDREPLALVDFRGKGVAIGAPAGDFTLDGMLNALRTLWRQAGGAPALQPPPAPAARPRALPGPGPWSSDTPDRRSSPPAQHPGWYADPSGHNRMRWWDGEGWTAHVR